MHFNGPSGPGGSKIKLDWPVRNCVCKHAAASGGPLGACHPPKHFQILCSEIASEAIFGPFYSLIYSSWQALTMP